MQIGPHLLDNYLALAPMAGVTDRAFRRFCRRLGAGLTPTEMISANTSVYATKKTQHRLDHSGETGLRVVQIAGSEPYDLALAAKVNVDLGAQVIDINMGCPAKKVCKKLAGSALLSDERKVANILEAVVKAVDVPVTLKYRTGPDPDNKNAVTIAMLAEDAGIQALALHGRTRADRFAGDAEYETIAAVVASTRLPVFANGDIDTPQKALLVKKTTGAAGLMIGRAAQGNPWLFREIAHYIETGENLAPPTAEEKHQVLSSHLKDLYDLYGEYMGLRIARKHIGWYCRGIRDAAQFRATINLVDSADEQLELIKDFFLSEHVLAEDLQQHLEETKLVSHG